MERGSYVATSAGLFQFRKIEVVNNNLANINTPGFKKEIILGDEQNFDDTLAKAVAANDPFARGDHDRAPGLVNVRAETDFSPGPIKNTGNNLDVALRNPKDFFVINTAEGLQYTRAGNFTLNSEGQIVTMDGFPVNGDGGPITTEGAGVSISTDGSVKSGTEQVGKLQVVHLDNPESFERVGSSRFRLKPGAPTPAAIEADLIPQSLEMSNVTAIGSVIELINANRAFDSYSKSMQTIDTLNQSAIGQVGRTR